MLCPFMPNNGYRLEYDYSFSTVFCFGSIRFSKNKLVLICDRSSYHLCHQYQLFFQLVMRF
ncbi:hypothetical protein CW304_11950 [Bacillus sp. UFRGS-B20]|nr:hypothetical protein CW304_11950 [Bacillus sp. UFRGS-B20]